MGIIEITFLKLYFSDSGSSTTTELKPESGRKPKVEKGISADKLKRFKTDRGLREIM